MIFWKFNTRIINGEVHGRRKQDCRKIKWIERLASCYLNFRNLTIVSLSNYEMSNLQDLSEILSYFYCKI